MEQMIPIAIFLFVLFGALLEKAGAGRYFLDLAFAMVGRMRGGLAHVNIVTSLIFSGMSGSEDGYQGGLVFEPCQGGGVVIDAQILAWRRTGLRCLGMPPRTLGFP